MLENENQKVPCFSTLFADFKKYLKSKNIEFKNKNYVLYSCRHTFITTRLAQGVDIYLVAKYVGNSVETIQNFYDDYKLHNQEHIDLLTGRDRNKEAWDEYNRLMRENTSKDKDLGDIPFLTEEQEQERIKESIEAYNKLYPEHEQKPPNFDDFY